MFVKLCMLIYSILPINILKALYGLALCFFGGQFVVTTAAIEAFNQCGGHKMLKFFEEL